MIMKDNNDIETNRFNNILNTSGTNDHINDKVIDNNITYYHKPDHIASGFYTAERKIIPLSDKLLSMSNDIASLKSDILGNSSNCKVSLSIGDEHIDIYSDRENVITLESYNNFSSSNTYSSQYSSGVGSWDLMGDESVDTHDGAYIFKNGVVSTMINISLANTGDSTLKLYPIFPGNRNVLLNNTASTFVNKNNYCKNYNEGVWFKYQYGSDAQTLQTQNQFITFRINDAWTGETYYSNTANVSTNNTQNSNNIQSVSGWNLGMLAYPYVTTKYGLCIDSDDARSYATINPGEEIIIPIYCEFVATAPNTMIEKTISFDIRTSLYSDPINYSFKIVGKNTASIQDKLTIANKRRLWDRLITPLKYRTTIK